MVLGAPGKGSSRFRKPCLERSGSQVSLTTDDFRTPLTLVPIREQQAHFVRLGLMGSVICVTRPIAKRPVVPVLQNTCGLNKSSAAAGSWPR